MRTESTLPEEAVSLDHRPTPLRELRDSLVLIGLVLSSMSAYLALGALAVKWFAGP